VLELLVVDAQNPRSVSYQLHRIQNDLRAMPNTSPTARPLRLLDSLLEHVRITRLAVLIETTDGRRDALDGYLGGLLDQLRVLAEAIRDQFQQQPPTQQPIFGIAQAGRR